MPAPEPQSAPDGLTLLGEIERRWQDALSHVHAADPQSAITEVEQAGELLARLHRLNQELRDPVALKKYTTHIQRLSRLHLELTSQTRLAMDKVGKALGVARDGRSALRAYGEHSLTSPSCDNLG